MIRKTDPLYELEGRVETILQTQGPLIGKNIVAALDGAALLDVWKVCHQSNLFRIVNCARYYLRYDIRRENQLRLSPSLLRDFLSFTLVHLTGQKAEAIDHGVLLSNYHRQVSMKKLDIARQAILFLEPDIYTAINANACGFVAGDIAYFLAHEEAREHTELGIMIEGSDIDILFVYSDDLDPDIIQAAERQMLTFKYRALKDSRIKQEVDFLFKPISKMKKQYQYSNIHEKIACKILYESLFLFGRIDIYDALRQDLNFLGTTQKIEDDFKTALSERKTTIQRIFDLHTGASADTMPEIQSLFFFSQERLEFQ